jgi:glycosyltransferase involved in cell wall biosynthesis
VEQAGEVELQAANGEAPGRLELVIVTPVFNDWESLALLVRDLDERLAERGMTAHVVAINDGPVGSSAGLNWAAPLRAVSCVEVVDLTRNMGHQRAIAIGLAYVSDNYDPDAVVVMDSDGEDSPADVPRLVEKCRQEGMQKLIFAERHKRSEPLKFRVFYVLYKVLFHLLTGQVYRVGNFSVIPRRCLASLVTVSEIWNHYAAAVFKSRQPHAFLPTRRATRLMGQSKMNFTQLLIHGLSAISVYGENVGIRLLLLSSVMIAISFTGIVVVTAIRVLTTLAIPGWASTVVGNLVLLLFQSVLLSAVFSFIVLSGRQGASFFPIRDYHPFVCRSRKAEIRGNASE